MVILYGFCYLIFFLVSAYAGWWAGIQCKGDFVVKPGSVKVTRVVKKTSPEFNNDPVSVKEQRLLRKSEEE